MVKDLRKDIVFNEDIHFLDGPNSRGKDFFFALKSFIQFIKGFRKLHFVGPCISVFGSARIKKNDYMYHVAEEFGKRIASMGLTVMTGGGPGIMEAANKGAFENGGRSVGCTIRLPHEQSTNLYLDRKIEFDFFFVRKVLLIKYSHAFIVLPGGFGTLDELFETLTLIQTSILHNFPVVIFGETYYGDLKNMIDNMLLAKTISIHDLNLIKFTDDIDEAMSHVSEFIKTNYKIKLKPKPWWILGEELILKNKTY